MSLESIITVQIDRTSTTVSQTGFGQPMIVGYFPTSIFPQRSKEYSSLTEMTDDGFLSTDPLNLCASDCWAQNPSPPTIKIGRRLGAPQQVMEITPDDPVPAEDLSLDRFENEDRVAREVLEHRRHNDHILVAQGRSGLDRIAGLDP